MDKPSSSSVAYTRPGTLFSSGHRIPMAAAPQRPAWPFKVQSRHETGPGRNAAPPGRHSFIS